jgi:hypothetical protein
MAVPHVRTHVAMLGAALRRRDRREIVGQVVRLLVAAPGSWTGRYPVGNTGGADVSALRPMPIPADLQVFLEGHNPHTGGSEGNRAEASAADETTFSTDTSGLE